MRQHQIFDFLLCVGAACVYSESVCVSVCACGCGRIVCSRVCVCVSAMCVPIRRVSFLLLLDLRVSHFCSFLNFKLRFILILTFLLCWLSFGSTIWPVVCFCPCPCPWHAHSSLPFFTEQLSFSLDLRITLYFHWLLEGKCLEISTDMNTHTSAWNWMRMWMWMVLACR